MPLLYDTIEDALDSEGILSPKLLQDFKQGPPFELGEIRTVIDENDQGEEWLVFITLMRSGFFSSPTRIRVK